MRVTRTSKQSEVAIIRNLICLIKNKSIKRADDVLVMGKDFCSLEPMRRAKRNMRLLAYPEWCLNNGVRILHFPFGGKIVMDLVIRLKLILTGLVWNIRDMYTNCSVLSHLKLKNRFPPKVHKTFV